MPDHLHIEVLLSLPRKLIKQGRAYCELDREAEAGQFAAIYSVTAFSLVIIISDKVCIALSFQKA